MLKVSPSAVFFEDLVILSVQLKGSSVQEEDHPAQPTEPRTKTRFANGRTPLIHGRPCRREAMARGPPSPNNGTQRERVEASIVVTLNPDKEPDWTFHCSRELGNRTRRLFSFCDEPRNGQSTPSVRWVTTASNPPQNLSLECARISTRPRRYFS